MVNPIILNSPCHNTSDPYVIRHNDFYYHCYSNDEGIFISKSETLEKIGEGEAVKVYNSKENGALKSWYAPELHNINGKWYIYASPDYGNSLHVMSVLECDFETPMGNYHNLGMIKGLENVWSIDGTVLKYNGEMYFVWTNCIELHIHKMASPSSVTGDSVIISKAEYEFELRCDTINEGPAVLYHKDKIYIVYSANDSKCDDYCLGLLCFSGNGDIMDAKNWHKHPNAVFEKTDKIFGPGHCSFTTVTENGAETDYIVYHANLTSDTGWNGRSVFAKSFCWNENDFPVFGKPEF